MIRRLMAVLCFVCWWCAAQAAPDSEELERRVRSAETERSHGRLTAAESILLKLTPEIEHSQGSGVLLAMALREQGLLRDDEGRPEEAIPLYEHALGMVRAQPGASPVIVGVLLANLASSHASTSDPTRGLALSIEALSVLQTAVERTDPAFAVALCANGIALHALGRNTEALKALRESLEIRRSVAEPDYPQIALIHESIAKCLFVLGYDNLAEASEREALSIRTKIFEPDSPGIGAALNNLGVILGRSRRWSQSREALEKAAEIFEQYGESEQKQLTVALENLGRLYYAQAGDDPTLYAKAQDVYRRKLAIEEHMFGASDVHVAATLEMLGEVLYRERAYNEAGRTYERGLAIQEAAFGSSNPQTKAAAHRYRVMLKKMKGDVTK